MFHTSTTFKLHQRKEEEIQAVIVSTTSRSVSKVSIGEEKLDHQHRQNKKLSQPQLLSVTSHMIAKKKFKKGIERSSSKNLKSWFLCKLKKKKQSARHRRVRQRE
jgi:hypothetical protein